MKESIESSALILNKILSVNSIYGAGYYNPSDMQTFCKCEYSVLIFSNGNNTTINFANENVVLNSGELIFIKPEIEFSITVLGNNPTYACLFVLKASYDDIVYGRCFYVDGIKKSILSRLLWATNDLFVDSTMKIDCPSKHNENASIYSEQIAKNSLELLILDCIKPVNKPINIDFTLDINVSESKHTTDKIINYLYANLSKNITLDEIADALIFSKSYIKQVFKKETGKSIIKFFNELKIEEAKKMLSNGEDINSVGASLGFGSTNYFTQTFKQHTGLTPNKYRRSLHP